LEVIVLSNLSAFDPADKAARIANLYLADRFAIGVPVARMEQRAETAFDPELYDAYVGRYRFPDGLLATIDREGDRLMGQVASLPRAELHAESETEFIVHGLNVRIWFHTDEHGTVSQVTVRQGGHEMRGQRVALPSLTVEQLAEYAGAYHSDELDVTYRLIAGDGELVARCRWLKDLPLIALEADLFALQEPASVEVRFVRDGAGQVTGLRLTSGRVRNLRFDRRRDPRRDYVDR
jgi:hypothetical protein